eukprot:6197036-Pleurochrysis_carterae.AAC.5
MCAAQCRLDSQRQRGVRALGDDRHNEPSTRAASSGCVMQYGRNQQIGLHCLLIVVRRHIALKTSTVRPTRIGWSIPLGSEAGNSNQER